MQILIKNVTGRLAKENLSKTLPLLWKEQKKIINFTFTAFFNKEATKIPVDNPITMKKNNSSLPLPPLFNARHLLQVKSILQFIGDKTPVLIWQSQKMSSSTRRNRVAFSDWVTRCTSSSALSLEISSARFRQLDADRGNAIFTATYNWFWAAAP